MKHNVVGYLEKEKSVLLYLQSTEENAPVTRGVCCCSAFVPRSSVSELSSLIGTTVELKLYKKNNKWCQFVKILREESN